MACFIFCKCQFGWVKSLGQTKLLSCSSDLCSLKFEWAIEKKKGVAVLKGDKSVVIQQKELWKLGLSG